MRRIFIFAAVIMTVGSLTLTNGQNADSKTAVPAVDTTALSKAAVDSLLISAANQAISQFSSQLQTSLKVALDDGGPLNAVNVCNVVAPDIQTAHVRDGWFLERVTAKPRNRNNQADSAQLVILAKFEAATNAPSFVAQWNDPIKREKFRFYRPIRTNEMCAGCHGDPASFVTGLTEELKKLYPDDKAVGYRSGDLRGMFAIEVMWPEGLAYAQKLAASVKRDTK